MSKIEPIAIGILGIAVIVLILILATSNNQPQVLDYSGVVATNTTTSVLGVTVWNVNKVGSFAVGDTVQVAWALGVDQAMTGVITAVSATNNTITVNCTSIQGDQGISWTPWNFILLKTSS